MSRIKITFIFFFLLFISFTNKALSQIFPLSQNTKVSVITCGSGNELYSLFGHTAIRIADPENHIDEVYNYGTFDFNTPNFYLKFIKGDLQYLESSNTYDDFLEEYRYEKRAVYEQILNLSQNQKQQLFDYLNASLRSEERFYTYKFIDKNCTTMVINVLNKTLGKECIVKMTDKEKTYREILYPYFEDHFYAKLGISIVFGKKVDLKGEQLFLPAELQKSIKTIQYNHQPICTESRTILEFKKEDIPFSWWDNFYAFALLTFIIIVLNNNRVYMVYFLLMSLLGLFLSFAGFYSWHKELEYNYNVLLFNPFLLLLVYFYLKNNRKAIYYICLGIIFSIVMYLVIMINKAHLVIVLPLVFTSLVGLIKLIIQNKNLVISMK